MHRVYLDPSQLAIPAPGQVLIVTGSEAEHALVRRLRVAEPVEVLDGRGAVAAGVVTSLHPPRGKSPAQLALAIESVRALPPLEPALTVCSATPKGDRAAAMIDALAQLGAARWQPLRSARTVVDPGDHKLDRLARVALAAAKQSGRAHAMSIGPPVTFDDLLAARPPSLLAADALGVPPAALGQVAEAPAITILIGPEGGWTPDEFAALRAAGVTLVRLGPHTLRTETAAIAAAAILLRDARADGSTPRA